MPSAACCCRPPERRWHTKPPATAAMFLVMLCEGRTRHGLRTHIVLTRLLPAAACARRQLPTACRPPAGACRALVVHGRAGREPTAAAAEPGPVPPPAGPCASGHCSRAPPLPRQPQRGLEGHLFVDHAQRQRQGTGVPDDSRPSSCWWLRHHRGVCAGGAGCWGRQPTAQRRGCQLQRGSGAERGQGGRQLPPTLRRKHLLCGHEHCGAGSSNGHGQHQWQ